MRADDDHVASLQTSHINLPIPAFERGLYRTYPPTFTPLHTCHTTFCLLALFLPFLL